jgi:hypothetical protein
MKNGILGKDDRQRRVRGTVRIGQVDELLGIARELDPSLEPKYNKFYIGLVKNGGSALYRMSLTRGDITKNRPLLKDFMQAAYQGRST